MYRDNTEGKWTQWLARLGSVALLAGIVAAGCLTLTGYTYAAGAAQPKPTVQSAPKALTPKAPEPKAPAPKVVYDYAAPVPASAAAADDYFADAALIGDSRTEGLVLYGKLKPGASFAYRGLNVQSARTDKVIKGKDGRKYTAIGALQQGTYQKIYLALGINELGWYNNERYYQNYADLIDLVRAAQPGAQIYLQTLIPVTAAKSASSYVNNPQVLVYNDLIQTLAQEKQVYLLDVWAAFADKNGALPASGSSDGVHLTKAYYGKWRDYLLTHTVTPAP